MAFHLIIFEALQALILINLNGNEFQNISETTHSLTGKFNVFLPLNNNNDDDVEDDSNVFSLA